MQAIQDITRSYDIPPDDIVSLIYEKIDVNNEGENGHMQNTVQSPGYIWKEEYFKKCIW